MPAPSGVANGDTIEQYLDWLDRTRRRSATTVDGYRRTLGHLAEWADGRPLLDLTLADLEAFVLRPRARVATPSAATQRLETAVVRGLFKWAGTRGMLRGEDPTVTLSEQAPQVRNDQPRPVADDDWLAVWRSDLSDSMRVALGLGYFCGLRRSEIQGLAPEQIDLRERVIRRVLRKGGRHQDVRYGSSVDVYEKRLQHLLVEPEWFLGPLGRLSDRPGRTLLGWAGAGGTVPPNSLNKRLWKACRDAGADPFGPHQLRHSFCTNMVLADIPVQVVQKLAGHRSIQVTMRYVDVGDDPLARFL